MESLFTTDALISLLTLTLLEVVLGIDNVIFITIVSGKLPVDQRKKAQNNGLLIALVLRIALLFAISWVIGLKEDVLTLFGHGFSGRDLILLGGGLFLLYSTTKEIHHKLEGEEDMPGGKKEGKSQSFIAAIGQIMLVDMIFSFDSMITAVGIAKHVEVMIVAVVIAMFIMFLFSAHIAAFIHKHPTLKMLALSFLVMVGVVLIIEGWDSEGAHALGLKNYVYFAMAFSFAVELLNMRVRKVSRPPVELHEPDPEKVDIKEGL